MPNIHWLISVGLIRIYFQVFYYWHGNRWNLKTFGLPIVKSEYEFSLNVSIANVFHIQCGNGEDNSQALGIQNVKSLIKDCTNNFVQQNIMFKNGRYSSPCHHGSIVIQYKTVICVVRFHV